MAIKMIPSSCANIDAHAGAFIDNTDDASAKIKIIIHINRQHESTNDLNPSHDTLKTTELVIKPIKFNNLKADIPTAFLSSSAKITSLFKDNNYEWKVFLYDPTKADIEITSNNDLQAEVAIFNRKDNHENEPSSMHNKFIKLRIVFFKRNLDDEKSTDELEVKLQNIDASPHKKSKSTIIVQKGEIISHYIKPTHIDNDTIFIKLSLNKPVTTTTKYVIHEYGNETGAKLADIEIEKDQKDATVIINPKDIDHKLFKIAIYQKLHDTKPISNILSLTISDARHAKDYAPSSISLSTVKAIDNKDDNIYVYFDFPEKIHGKNIDFKISYIGDDKSGNDYKAETLPIIIPKSLIPRSFTIITTSLVDNKECVSKPSDIITIDYRNTIIEKDNNVSEDDAFEEQDSKYNDNNWDNEFEYDNAEYKYKKEMKNIDIKICICYECKHNNTLKDLIMNDMKCLHCNTVNNTVYDKSQTTQVYTYDIKMIEELEDMGYDKPSIIEALNNIKNKRDINHIIEYIGKKQHTNLSISPTDENIINLNDNKTDDADLDDNEDTDEEIDDRYNPTDTTNELLANSQKR
eukprot:441117_1